MQKSIDVLTLTELKALAYDEMYKIEISKKNLEVINMRMKSLAEAKEVDDAKDS